MQPFFSPWICPICKVSCQAARQTSCRQLKTWAYNEGSLQEKHTRKSCAQNLKASCPLALTTWINQPRAVSSVEQMTGTEAGRSIESGAVGPLSLGGPRGGGVRVQDTFHAQIVGALITFPRSKVHFSIERCGSCSSYMVYTQPKKPTSQLARGMLYTEATDLWHRRDSTLVQTLPTHLFLHRRVQMTWSKRES